MGNESKTETDDAGMDDDLRIQRIEEKSTAKRMASFEVETCWGSGRELKEDEEDGDATILNRIAPESNVI
jgi:hypothetical protein